MTFIFIFLSKIEPLRSQPFGPELPSGLSLRVEDMAEERPLRWKFYKNSRGSVILPVTAVAAAVAGLAR